MKPAFTLLLLAALSFFSYRATAQTINIPDGNFLNALVTTNCADLDGDGIFEADADSDNDGNIQLSEAQALWGLKVNSRQIHSLEGIEQFANLKHLDCNANFLTALPIENLTGLIYLNCSLNNLTALNVQNLVNLKTLQCGINDIGNLALDNLTELETLHCFECLLSTLEIQNLQKLRELNCSFNQISTLDLLGLDSLTALDCAINNLSTLNLQGLTRLTSLNCGGNGLDTLDLHGLINLKSLGCSNTGLSTLNVQEIPGLEQLFCRKNNLTALNLFGMAELRRLECGENNLTTLDVRSSPLLEYMACESNQLVSLFIKNGQNNSGTTPDFSNNPLAYICCDESQISFVEYLLELDGNVNCIVTSACDFIAPGSNNLLLGIARLDLDQNGCDASDAGYPSLAFQIQYGTGSDAFTTAQSGSYYLPLGTGTYQVIPENPLYFTASPDTFNVELTATSTVVVQDFCISADGTHHDVEILIIPLLPARPGFPATYRITCTNKGTQLANGSVTLVFDHTRMAFTQASLLPALQTGDTLRWNFTDLSPLEKWTTEVEFLVNSPSQVPPVNPDDILLLDAVAEISETDELPDDNIAHLRQVVVGSFDPNDKTCLQGQHITPDMVGDYLNYLIRFENTGTFAAENIVVRDSIDTSKFDIASLRLIEASHDCFVRINGNLVDFIFENIQLPFTEPGKHGFVAFKIKTKPALDLGTAITNKAAIYFDFNLPVITNVATTTVSETITTHSPGGQQMNLYLRPNPAQDVLFLQTDLAIERVEVYDALGKMVLSTGLQNSQINIANLPAGNFVLKVYGPASSVTRAFVKR